MQQNIYLNFLIGIPGSANKMWNVGTPVENFAGRVQDLATIHSILMNESSQHKVVVCGHGGIGKTEIALQYCHTKVNTYDAINWLNAESPYTLFAGFKHVCQHLEIPLADDDDVISLVRNITNHYRDKNVLFVLDNVKDEHSISDCIYPESPNIKFLFTSQSNTWSENIVIHELDLFTEDIAVDLIQSGINSDLFCLESCKKIVEKLEYLPLAIQLALCYMKKFEMSTHQYNILLNEEFEHLRHRVFHPRYAKTINTSFSITIENIKKVEDKDVIELARVIAHLDGKEMSEKLLLCIDLEGKFDPKAALKILSGYSLIKKNEDTGHYAMHSLLQLSFTDDISRSSEQLTSNVNNNVYYISKIIAMIQKYKTNLNNYHITYGEDWVKHITSIFNNINNNEIIFMMLDDILNEAVRTLIDNCASYNIALDILKTKLTFEEEHNLPATFTKSLIAKCLYDKGDVDDALTIYREVYQTQTIKLGSDHPDTLITRHNLAKCLHDKGDVDDALTIYREVYQTPEQLNWEVIILTH